MNEDINKNEPIPYIAHESMMARQERTIKRLWILCITIFIALIITNCGWMYYQSISDSITVTQESPGGDNTSYIYGDRSAVDGIKPTEKPAK